MKKLLPALFSGWVLSNALLMLPEAGGQNQSPKPNANQNRLNPNPFTYKKGSGAPQNKDYKSSRMKTPPRLQYLPDYTGAKAQFQDALAYPGVKGHAYNIRWRAREDQETVMSWYNQVFNQYGWTVPKNTITETSITAMRPGDGITCIVTALKMKAQGFKTMIVIRYLEAPPKGG